MRSYLVTGAAGFIGYHVCQGLLDTGHKVVGADSLSDYYSPQLKKDRLAELAKAERFHFQQLELSDRFLVESLFGEHDFDSVIHLAAQPGVRYSIENPHAYIDSNIVAFTNVLEGCRHQRPTPLVYASSSSVYGGNTKIPFAVGDPVESPVSLYAATKKANELIATSYSHLYGMAITGLRFFTVYGPWGRPDMAVWKFAEAIENGEPIDVYNHGRMRRDFTYIDDIVDGVERAFQALLDQESGNEGQHKLYNLGNNQPIELSRLISALENALGVKAVQKLLPIQPGDVLETFADIESSKQELGFSPKTTIEEGLRRFVTWRHEYQNRNGALASPT